MGVGFAAAAGFEGEGAALDGVAVVVFVVALGSDGEEDEAADAAVFVGVPVVVAVGLDGDEAGRARGGATLNGEEAAAAFNGVAVFVGGLFFGVDSPVVVFLVDDFLVDDFLGQAPPFNL